MKHFHRYMIAKGGKLGTPPYYGLANETSGLYGTWSLGSSIASGTGANTVAGVTADPTGTIVMVVHTNDNLREYSLSTPWDITTASTTLTSNNIGANLYGIHYWSPTRIIANTGSGTITYGCTDYSIVASVPVIGTKTGGPFNTGIFGHPDGTDWYVGDSTNSIRQYSAASPYLTNNSASLVVDKAVTTPGNWVAGINISPDGKWLLYMGSSTNFKIYLYEMTTPWSLSTAVSRTSWDVTDGSLGTSLGMHYDFTAQKGFVRSESSSEIYNLIYTPV